MGIFSRMSDIVNSNITAILDRAEDPSKIVRLVIQEMEDTLIEVRADAARLIADRKECERRLSRLSKGVQEWQDRAELAINRDREDLARAALVEKKRLADALEDLMGERGDLDERLKQLDTDIANLETKLSEAKAKQKTLADRHRTVSARTQARAATYDRRIDDALARFDMVERKLDEAEGRMEAFEVGRPTDLATEIEALETDSQIEAEFAELKERLKGGPASAGRE